MVGSDAFFSSLSVPTLGELWDWWIGEEEKLNGGRRVAVVSSLRAEICCAASSRNRRDSRSCIRTGKRLRHLGQTP